MNQKKIINIMGIIGLVTFARGADPFSVNQHTLSRAPGRSAARTATDTQIPSPYGSPELFHEKSVLQIMAVVGNMFSVVELLTNKEHYLGTQVRVKGKIVVNIIYSERPCPQDGSVCDTSVGAQLELWQAEPIAGIENKILIFRNGESYPCEKIAPEQYRCAPYVDGELSTLNGVWSKDEVPDQIIGYSSGQPPIVLKWKDRYFLDVKV